MMVARRYLTARYDVTGIARKLYLSPAREFVAIGLVAGLVLLLFALFHGPVVTDRVALNTFAPVEWIELGDWILGGTLATLLLLNAARMHRHVMAGTRAPLSAYLAELKAFVLHAATQRRWRECGERPLRWRKHFLIVTGYVTIFLLVFVFLRWFQTDAVHPWWHPTRVLGYYATAVLLLFTAEAMIGRFRKRERIHRHSHTTDWVFLGLLFLTAATGILVHVVRLSGLPLTTYLVYTFHLAVAVAMLVVEVPFGKWAHLLYRPLAIYLTRVKERAAAAAGTPAPAPARA
jgi:quinone-modifying oxidoreductase subunit QmoC